MAEHEYRPGDNVPRSGIYLVTHDSHREPHESVILEAARFPACHECGDRVRYRQLRVAGSLESDPDFANGASSEKPPAEN